MERKSDQEVTKCQNQDVVGPKFDSRWPGSRAHALDYYALMLLILRHALTIFLHYFFYIAAIVTFLTFKDEHVTFPDYNVSLWAHFPQENFSSWTRLIRLFRLQSALISPPYPLEQGLTFSEKGQVANVFSFADHRVSVAIILVCCHSAKAATDNMQMNGYGCIPITLYLQRQAVGGFDTPHTSTLH